MTTGVEETTDKIQENALSASNEVPVLEMEPDLKFIDEMAQLSDGSFEKCYQCATCSATCPISPDNHPFPRKEMVWAMWGLKDRLLKNPDL